ncbi:MAG: hypothetical protein M1497_05135 [Nitrospirae bacterium]|nr:hypothetical protein [Nitrospirota bacterium]
MWNGPGWGREYTTTLSSRRRIAFPVGQENGLAGTPGARELPVTVFITKEGKIAKRHLGLIDYAELAANIEAILE